MNISLNSNGLQSHQMHPTELLEDVMKREIVNTDVTNLLQLCNAVTSVWTNISEQCFQHLSRAIMFKIN